MSSNGIVVTLLALTLGTTVYLAANLPGSPEPGTIVAGGAETDAHDRQAKAIEGLRKDMQAMQSRVDRRLGAIEARVGRAAAERRTRPREDGATDPAGTDAPDGPGLMPGDDPLAADEAVQLEDALAERMERTVEDKLERIAARQRNRGGDGKWKPPLEDLARELDLDEEQQETLRVVFDRTRDRVMELLTTQHDDGTNVLDDLADAYREGGDGAAVGRGFFTRLASDTVPGTDQTYLSALEELGEDTRLQVEPLLREGQRERLAALKLDFLDVKTGHDPVGGYIRERLEQPE